MAPRKQISESFDFDTVVDRRTTASVKWDKYQGKDIIPLWVADMDFISPPAVLEVLHRRIDHGVFGYTRASAELIETVQNLLLKRYGWQVQPEWIIWLPGVVTALNVVCRAVGRDDDAVMTTVPVYPPFLSAPGFSRRRLITVPLKRQSETWTIDFDRLQAAITPRTRLFILCHPHNPVGRVYGMQELMRLLDICDRNDIVICSDEIHCDLILERQKKHLPLAGISPAAARRTITLMAPSKTYNLPGLGCSFAVISDPDLRRRFKQAMAGIVPHVNTMGLAAARAAYRDGGAWHAALLDYLRANRDRVARFVRQQPGLSMTPVEATYLAWIDVRALKLEKPVDFFEKAGVGLSDGAEFGGPGYVRLNFGCPRSLLDKALERMKKALEKLGSG